MGKNYFATTKYRKAVPFGQKLALFGHRNLQWVLRLREIGPKNVQVSKTIGPLLGMPLVTSCALLKL